MAIVKQISKQPETKLLIMCSYDTEYHSMAPYTPERASVTFRSLLCENLNEKPIPKRARDGFNHQNYCLYCTLQ